MSMAKTHEYYTQGLSIDAVHIFKHEHCPNGGICIEWSGAVGFGEYTLVLEDDGKFHADSEHMERTEDKYFSKELFRLLHEMIVVDD
jgi:hypothetical protein